MERGIMSLQRQTGRHGRLSVIVPATSVAALEETLISVLEHRPEGCDVVVALGTPYDDPWNIREEVTFVDLPKGSGLVDCINAGVAASSGDVIHILAAGWKAVDGWTVPAMRHFASGRVAAVVPLAVSEADRFQPVSAGIRRTAGGRSVTVVPSRKGGGIVTGRLPAAPMIEAGFWRADVLHDIGFSKACGDALAAADMAAALVASRADVVLEPESRVVSGPTLAPSSSFQAGLLAERLFWRSLPCERTGTALVAHVGEIMRHAALTAPLGTIGMLAGRLAALVQFGSCLSRTRQLHDLMRRPADRDGAIDTDVESRTYRIDEPHESAGRPRVASPSSPLKRSA
jgi:hypothetical protein